MNDKRNANRFSVITIIHDRLIGTWRSCEEPYPIQEHAVVFSGVKPPDSRFTCRDDGSELKITIMKTGILVDDGTALKWKATDDPGRKVIIYDCPICDAMESWTFFLTAEPYSLDDNPDYRRVEQGIYVAVENELAAQEWLERNCPDGGFE